MQASKETLTPSEAFALTTAIAGFVRGLAAFDFRLYLCDDYVGAVDQALNNAIIAWSLTVSAEMIAEITEGGTNELKEILTTMHPVWPAQVRAGEA